ncbi:SprT-like family-domain-containing protein [Rhizoctonia solani]|nr:SprT-like family-domain-containing protein [Rhizoctonia solani]
MPREVDVSKHLEESSEEDSPAPRRAHGTRYRNRAIVISDSESDSDLPSPSLLLQECKAVGPASNIGSVSTTDEIIAISSDSEIEATPTKPRGGKLPSNGHGHPAVKGGGSVSALNSVFHSSFSLSANDDMSQNKTTVLSRPTNSSSTDNEEIDETRLFDQDAHHPGILHFNTGPRKPVLLASHSSTSISTSGTSGYSRDLYGEDGIQPIVRAGSPSKGYSDDSSEDVREVNNPVESPRPKNTTENGKTNGSGSGYRSRVQVDINEGVTLPETPRPRPRPKPKARSAALTLASVPTSSPKSTPRNQAKILQAVAISLFAELNESVFGGKLPKDCPIEWSKKLNTTAGRAHWKRIRDADGNVTRHDTRIELSTKVVDCEERVRNTLSHEMCHLGAWVFDSEMKPPHGSAFKRWSDRIMEARPDITISTCHSYEISYKYEWKCSSGECGRTYGRHSKSIDPEKQVCGACRSKLVPQFETAPKRTPFQDYLKTHMKDFKAANPGIQHGEVMRRLGEMFRAEKEARVDEELEQVMAGMTSLGISSRAG